MRHGTARSVRDDSGHPISSLVGDLLADAELLVRQEVALIRKDFQEDLRLHEAALRRIGSAVVFSFFGRAGLALSFVYLFHEGVGLKLWQSYGSVGILLMVFGRLLFHQKSKGKENSDANSIERLGETKHGNTIGHS